MEQVFKQRLLDQTDSGNLPNWIGGKECKSTSVDYQDVLCPYTGKVIAHVPLSNEKDLDRAVKTAQTAFVGWAAMNIKDRAQVLFRLKTLLESRLDDLGQLAALESGKTPEEGKAGLLKGIEVLEYGCSAPNMVAGRSLEVSRGVNCRAIKVPLGVCASITPFNFPFMVPFWTIPLTLVCGNAMILKPSEQAPLSPLRLARLLKEAGLPDGVFNVVNGSRTAVEAICDHPGIKAISFVGSSKVAKAVYVRGCTAGKRVLALGGAKNPLFLMPDADPDSSPKAIIDSAVGCAGQRCMAASQMIAVGDCRHIIDKMAEYARSIRLGTDIGATINQDSVKRIHSYIDQADEMGAEILVDGRHARVKGFPDGYWVGPTLMDNVTLAMPCSQEEIFGPVLSIIHVKTLEEAMRIENENPYGNAASVFTSSGAIADYVTRHASAGMIGINIGVPVPREPFGFGGWNQSKFGAGDITGERAINFWTRDKKATTRWVSQRDADWMSR